MGKLSLLASLVLVFLPSRLVDLLTPNRDSYRGFRIDPKAYAVGRFAAKMRGPGPMPTVAESRAQTLKSVALFDRKGPPLARIEDISLAGDNGPIAARLYSDHTDKTSLRPAMVYFHGGGFIQGDLESHHALCSKLAKWGGCIVVSVAYRLAPEHRYPAGVDDAISGYLGVCENATELGIDPAHIGVGGDSAGGCFAAVLCQQMRGQSGPMPDFQLLIYPVTDGHLATPSINGLEDAYLLPKTRMSWFRDEYAGTFRDFDDPKFSPLRADDLAGLPPCYVLTGGFDPLMDDGALYGKKLREAGVAVTHRHFTGQVHAFVNLTKVVPEGTQALLEISEWLRRKN